MRSKIFESETFCEMFDAAQRFTAGVKTKAELDEKFYQIRDKQQQVYLMSSCNLTGLYGDVVANKSPNRIYKMGEAFSRELLKVKIDLPFSLLHTPPESILIEVHPGILPAASGGYYTHLLVQPKHSSGSATSNFLLLGDNGLMDFVTAAASGSETVQQYINNIVGHGITPGNKDISAIETALTFICNTLLYLKSGEPDLRENRVKKPKGEFRVGNKVYGGQTNELSYTMVGFNYKKPPMYTIDETEVSGHFRWQPYGPGKAKVKLIWIDAHTRQYKTEAINRGTDEL